MRGLLVWTLGLVSLATCTQERVTQARVQPATNTQLHGINSVQASIPSRRPARVVGYATWENLTGCYAPGRCRTACGQLLDDRAFTVAANAGLGLACGSRVVLCRTQSGRGCVAATVNDRTASSFEFELTYRLALRTGAPRAGWDAPRTLYWRKR